MTRPNGRALLIAIAVAGLTLGAAATLITALGEDGASTRARATDPARATALRIESGDTLSAISGTGTEQSLTRIIGIDAPDPGECGFERAKRFLGSQLEQRAAYLRRDSLQPDRDKAGHRLRYLVMGDRTSPLDISRDVGYQSVASGWARVSLEHDFLLVAQYLHAQAEAQREQRGVWRCERREQL